VAAKNPPHPGPDPDAALRSYRAKRDFQITSEPSSGGAPGLERLRFVVQKHWASSLHYDFRLEFDGTLKSWAVPKGPSFDARDKRMAVHVEDHPISYAGFEGTIPENQYGAGKVIVWDSGFWTPLVDPREGYREGKLPFELHGHKLRGRWVLVRMRQREGAKQEPWLLIKERDEFMRPAQEFSVVDEMPDSVKALGDPARAGTGSGPAPAAARAATAKRASRSATPAGKAAAGSKRPAPDAPAREAASLASSPAPAAKAARAKPAGNASKPADARVGPVRVTHPERVMDPDSGVTKLELVRYYGLVGVLMMTHLKGRPVSLVRAPAGIGGQLFFQKHADAAAMPGLRELDPALDPDHPPMIAIAAARGLLSAAQWNVVEVHTMNTGTTSFAHPDRMVFDLDPGEGVGWAEVQEAAELLHAFLAELGLPAFLKTSGGKGLHVVVPVRKLHDWDTVKGFSRAVVEHMAATFPQRFVAKSGPKNRVGKIFIDYLRNGLGATTVAAWSARARPGLGISVPVDWSELASLRGGDHWTVRTAHTRLDRGNEPWSGYARAARGLDAAMAKLGVGPP
jgi:DNA ligase D-like protein (predicted polymerase)/DNA ligase D-like protein (predicted 3'-phosphoesterase)